MPEQETFEQEDVQAAANTPVGEIFAEFRNQIGQFKTSSILLGALLQTVRDEKKYKEKDFRSFKDFVASVGLNMQSVCALIDTVSVLQSKFPELLENIKQSPQDAYLPSSKAMNLAKSADLTAEQKSLFSAPTSMKRLREALGGSGGGEDDLPLDKIARSSRRFTRKVENSICVPDAIKTDFVQANAKLQRAAENEPVEEGQT